MGSVIPPTSFGRYELRRWLAHGGMSEVFVGVELDAGPDAAPVVVKRILPELGGDAQFVGMFINEAQLAAQMDHRNVVKVLEFGESEGRLFMVMEFVEGLDCWRFYRRMHDWGDDRDRLAIKIVHDVLSALEYAHGLTDVNGKSLSVVHRDLSPSNIYLSLGGDVKLGDFGIARIESRRYRPVKVIPKGKFGYMAPEQVEGRTVDRRADIYSAGVVLAELLIGRKLFTGRDQLGVMLEIKEGRLDTLEKNADRLDKRLMETVRRALARNPDDRFQSAAEFQRALLRYLDVTGETLPSAEELGSLVHRAIELGDPRSTFSGRTESTPITGDAIVTSPRPGARVGTPTLDRTERGGRDLGEAVREGGGIGRGGEVVDLEAGLDEDGTPITVDSRPFRADGRYVIRMADGSIVGPTSYAHVIELIYSDKITHETPVSMDGQEFAPAAEMSELARHLPSYTPIEEVDEADTPDRRGILEMESTCEVLLSLALREETGLLICQTGAKHKEVYLRIGRPFYVTSNEPGELLGEYLVARGHLDRMELDMALALLPKFDGHMGDTLVALGMVSAVDLFVHIGAQIRERFDGLLEWSTGTYEFYRGVSCRRDILEVEINPYEAVREKLLADLEALDEGAVFEKMSDSLVAPTPQMEKLLGLMKVPEDIAARARSVRDWASLGSLDEGAGPERRLLVHTLYVALESGLWTFDGPTPAWREGDAES